jgi:hypothetical protein
MLRGTLRKGAFGQDECGSMNEWLAVAPTAELTHGMVGCRVSVGDMADRPPRVLSNGRSHLNGFVASINIGARSGWGSVPFKKQRPGHVVSPGWNWRRGL